jgi:hypothetical protein
MLVQDRRHGSRVTVLLRGLFCGAIPVSSLVFRFGAMAMPTACGLFTKLLVGAENYGRISSSTLFFERQDFPR